jgi:membrane-associated PAP2 superfamily phosphatase
VLLALFVLLVLFVLLALFVLLVLFVLLAVSRFCSGAFFLPGELLDVCLLRICWWRRCAVWLLISCRDYVLAQKSPRNSHGYIWITLIAS